jgi:dTDP-4-amino-4,6-dideoxygalactose transaminase
MNKPVGGRGKKAPYESTHIRIPEPIKHRVEELKALYANDNLEEYDKLIAENQHLADEYRKLLTGNEQVSDSQEKVLPNLKEAIELAIKELAKKKSARETVTKLLTALYNQTVTIESLK